MARKKIKSKTKGSSGQNRAETETFLKKNRSKPDVIETASGLQYTVK